MLLLRELPRPAHTDLNGTEQPPTTHDSLLTPTKHRSKPLEVDVTLTALAVNCKMALRLAQIIAEGQAEGGILEEVGAGGHGRAFQQDCGSLGLLLITPIRHQLLSAHLTVRTGCLVN